MISQKCIYRIQIIKVGYPYYNTGCQYSDMGTEYGHPVIYEFNTFNQILKSQ